MSGFTSSASGQRILGSASPSPIAPARRFNRRALGRRSARSLLEPFARELLVAERDARDLRREECVVYPCGRRDRRSTLALQGLGDAVPISGANVTGARLAMRERMVRREIAGLDRERVGARLVPGERIELRCEKKATCFGIAVERGARLLFDEERTCLPRSELLRIIEKRNGVFLVLRHGFERIVRVHFFRRRARRRGDGGADGRDCRKAVTALQRVERGGSPLVIDTAGGSLTSIVRAGSEGNAASAASMSSGGGIVSAACMAATLSGSVGIGSG